MHHCHIRTYIYIYIYLALANGIWPHVLASRAPSQYIPSLFSLQPIGPAGPCVSRDAAQRTHRLSHPRTPYIVQAESLGFRDFAQFRRAASLSSPAGATPFNHQDSSGERVSLPSLVIGTGGHSQTELRINKASPLTS